MSEKSPKYKICSRCGVNKPEKEFAKNQYRKNNVVVRRAYCKVCAKKKKNIPLKLQREYEKVYPRPKLF